MNRYEYNMKILENLTRYLEIHKDARFWQALYNLDICLGERPNDEWIDMWYDIYNDESKDIYEWMDLSIIKENE